MNVSDINSGYGVFLIWLLFLLNSCLYSNYFSYIKRPKDVKMLMLIYCKCTKEYWCNLYIRNLTNLKRNRKHLRIRNSRISIFSVWTKRQVMKFCADPNLCKMFELFVGPKELREMGYNRWIRINMHGMSIPEERNATIARHNGEMDLLLIKWIEIDEVHEKRMWTHWLCFLLRTANISSVHWNCQLPWPQSQRDSERLLLLRGIWGVFLKQCV